MFSAPQKQGTFQALCGFFGVTGSDTVILSHELAEWVNDPFVNNPTPAWGNTGQVVGACQNNLEVGDPLTGT
jgi:hypothetical protein